MDQINLDKHKIHILMNPNEIMPKLSLIATKPNTEKLAPFKSPFLREFIYNPPQKVA
jgi:hypothetical protein